MRRPPIALSPAPKTSVRRTATAVVLSLLAALAVALTTTPVAQAAEGACAVVQANTAKALAKRTKAVKKARKQRNKARKKFRKAKKKAVNRVAKKKFVKARKKFRAAKKKRRVVVQKRKKVCATSTKRVSVSSAGVPGNGDSYDSVISANDRYVAFTSEASNLVPGDTNRSPDVFVHDRLNATTTRVSITNAGKQAEWGGQSPAISADGRYVAFVSNSADLGASGTGNRAEIFVRDRVKGTTTRATYSSNGTGHLDHWPGNLSMSHDGRYIAFQSFAKNVVAGAQSEMISGYMVDRVAKKNYRVSVSSTGAVANSWVQDVQISGNGRFVVYTTDATNYGFPAARSVPFDRKVFQWDRTTGTSRIVSVKPDGTLMDRVAQAPSVSADGRRVVFEKRKPIIFTPTSMSSSPESLQWYDRIGGAGKWTRPLLTGRFAEPALAPDASHLAYKRFTTGEPTVGVIKNLGTGREYVLVGRDGKGPGPYGFSDLSLSNGGRAMAFTTEATNLVAGDTDELADVYVWTR